MIFSKNMANAVGGKTARACDGCVKKRARWYCAADDAFLCQSCDSSVHSANPLARRHERVRLKTASLKKLEVNDSSNSSWFRKKARTPRNGKSKLVEEKQNPGSLVPEIGSDEISVEEYEEEQQLLYRVPIYDPFASELYNSTVSSEATNVNESESKDFVGGFTGDLNTCHGFLPSEMDLAEFAADVENLLGNGLENECFGIEELGLPDYKEDELKEFCSFNNEKVKLEDECHVDKYNTDVDITREQFELSFDYDSTEPDEKLEFKETATEEEEHDEQQKNKKRKIQLSLDYEAVITSWASKRSPWTNGIRPSIDINDCWPDCIGTCGTTVHHTYSEVGGLGGHSTITSDGGREARVSRYREKRRTRLFSKKIRYEVRKLNAEKRPRMKGRFVKRSSFQASCFPLTKKLVD